MIQKFNDFINESSKADEFRNKFGNRVALTIAKKKPHERKEYLQRIMGGDKQEAEKFLKTYTEEDFSEMRKGVQDVYNRDAEEIDNVKILKKQKSVKENFGRPSYSIDHMVSSNDFEPSIEEGVLEVIEDMCNSRKGELAATKQGPDFYEKINIELDVLEEVKSELLSFFSNSVSEKKHLKKTKRNQVNESDAKKIGGIPKSWKKIALEYFDKLFYKTGQDWAVVREDSEKVDLLFDDFFESINVSPELRELWDLDFKLLDYLDDYFDIEDDGGW